MASSTSQARNAVPEFLTGVIAPMYTPVHADGSLDLAGASEMVEWLVSCGCINTVFARSGMGKMFTFTMDETRRFAQAVHSALRGRMGMLLGAGGEWLDRESGGHAPRDLYTSQAIELTNFAAELGIDAAVHVLPAAIEPSAGETHADVVYAYYRDVSASTDLPIVLYQPGGMPEPYRLTSGLVERLVELPGIAGLKLSTTDHAVFGPIASVVRGGAFAMICGHEGYYADGLRQGAVGVIGQGCNGYPETLAAVQCRYGAGDEAGAYDAQAAVEKGLDITSGLDSSVALKQYIAHHGYRVGPHDRSGTPPYDESIVARVTRDLDALRAPYREELGLPTLGKAPGTG